MDDNPKRLLDLAEKRFTNLTEPDKKFFEHVAAGTPADFSSENKSDNDPGKAENWGPDRVLKADRISWACTDREASALLTHRGIYIKGARIEGKLDLEDAHMPLPFTLFLCALPVGMNFRDGHVKRLMFHGTHLGFINAERLQVDGNVFLDLGFKAIGEVRLLCATIGGDFLCRDATFENKKGPALQADGLQVGGAVHFDGKFNAKGGVRLVGATIGSDLVCSGATIEGVDPACRGGTLEDDKYIALVADGLQVGGKVHLDNGFNAKGGVRLVGATIGSDLSFSGATIEGVGSACRGGTLEDDKCIALAADGLQVGGSVFMRQRFSAKGEVNFVGAIVSKLFTWTDVREPESAVLNLTSSKIGIFWDEKASWPAPGNIKLEGFEYDSFYKDAPTDTKTRIEWLRLQRHATYRPQPYEQLATVFELSGRNAHARIIRIESAKERGRHSEMRWYEAIWHRALGLTIGYGYRPAQALWVVAAIVLFGAFCFYVGHESGMIFPTGKDAYIETDGGRQELAANYQQFNALVYSIDAFVPLMNLHQANTWLPVKGIVRFYLWLHIASGWILSTLLAVGLSGLIRR